MTPPKTKMTCVDTGKEINIDEVCEFIHPKTGERVSPLCQEAYDARVRGDHAEQVEHPNHYNQYSLECIDVIELFPHNIGAAIKYLWRAGEKGPEIRDYKKAEWYLQRFLEKRAFDTFFVHGIKKLEPRLTTVMNDEMEEIRSGCIQPLLHHQLTGSDIQVTLVRVRQRIEDLG